MTRAAVAVVILGLLACGRTTGNAVEQDRSQQADVKATTGQQAVATGSGAAADAAAAALRQAIDLRVYGKGFQPANWRVGRYDDSITIECGYGNTSGKDVRAFRGRLQFTDASGQEIFASDLTVVRAVPAGQGSTYSAVLKYNAASAAHQALRNTDLKDLTVTWSPTYVLFADGTSLGSAD